MILPFFMDVVAATKRIVFPLERKEKILQQKTLHFLPQNRIK
jgi:hypothetical protein